MKSKPGIDSGNPMGNTLHFRDILSCLSVAVYTCDSQGYITFYNKAAANLWGREPTPGEDLWHSFWKMYQTDGTPLPVQNCPMAITLKEGRPVHGCEIIVERPDGRRRTILPQPDPIFDDLGNLTGAFNMLIDITAQRETKTLLENTVIEKTNELKESEERYHRMIAEVQDYAILLLDTDGCIQNWNKGAEKIKGYLASEIVGRNFRIFYTQQDRDRHLPEQLLSEATANGKAIHEGWRVKKDGSMFWSSVVITALHDNDNNVIGFSKVTRDLTDKKKSDDALREKNRLIEEQNRELDKMNQELSSFVYISSHDLQEPLRKIQTFASYILHFEKERLSEKGQDLFQRLDLTANRMKTLIHDLLVYARTNDSKSDLALTQLNVFLQGAKDELKELIEEKQAIIVSDSLPELSVIPFQLQQLFTNIIGNSLKYAKKDIPPQISIKTGVIKGSSIPGNNAHAELDYHFIYFYDNGIGFAPANREKIFEIFNRLHTKEEYEGTGIGLAICKKIAENHHGFITADGKPGQGAVIQLYLPATSETQKLA